jgi:hypothetical protein
MPSGENAQHNGFVTNATCLGVSGDVKSQNRINLEIKSLFYEINKNIYRGKAFTYCIQQSMKSFS